MKLLLPAMSVTCYHVLPFPITILWFLCTSRIDHSCSALVGLPLGTFYFPLLLVISPNMSRFIHTCMMSFTGFLSAKAFCIGFQYLSVTGCDPSYLNDLCMLVSIIA